MRSVLIAVVFIVCASICAQADVQKTNDKLADAFLQEGANSVVISFDGFSPPSIRPKLANIKRTYSPNADALITKFLGGRQTLIGDGQSVVSPIWGKGTRYKSGTVFYAMPVGNKNPIKDLRQFPKLESVPAFLDVYPSGFLYTNNVEHKGVIATEVKVKGKADSDISYRKVYDRKDGQAAVEQMLPGMVGELKVPKGFRKSLSDVVQNYGERLYAYHVNPEYLTTYDVLGKDGKTVVAQKPVGVPVLDSYAHILLDGDKVLAGMEYFWDNSLTIQGTPQPCLQAATAVAIARQWLLERYKGAPPLYNVSNMRLGFIQDRNNRTVLVPAWIFDAWYITPLPSAVGTTENPVKRTNDPFAVRALKSETGKYEVIDL